MDLTAREFVVTVGAENTLTIPEPVAARYGLEPGRRFVVVDHGTADSGATLGRRRKRTSSTFGANVRDGTETNLSRFRLLER